MGQWICPRLAPNEKFHSCVWATDKRPYAVVEVHVRDNLDTSAYWAGHYRYKLVGFEREE